MGCLALESKASHPKAAPPHPKPQQAGRHRCSTLQRAPSQHQPNLSRFLKFPCEDDQVEKPTELVHLPLPPQNRCGDQVTEQMLGQRQGHRTEPRRPAPQASLGTQESPFYPWPPWPHAWWASIADDGPSRCVHLLCLQVREPSAPRKPLISAVCPPSFQGTWWLLGHSWEGYVGKVASPAHIPTTVHTSVAALPPRLRAVSISPF